MCFKLAGIAAVDRSRVLVGDPARSPEFPETDENDPDWDVAAARSALVRAGFPERQAQGLLQSAWEATWAWVCDRSAYNMVRMVARILLRFKKLTSHQVRAIVGG